LLSLAPVGFSGLEVAVGAYAAAVPDLPLDRFVALLATNPARLLGLPAGTLEIGAPGDVTIFAERPWVVDVARFHSLGKNTPFAGMTFSRRAIATIVAGYVVYEDGRVIPRGPDFEGRSAAAFAAGSAR
jgi:dihydroorotase